MGDRKPSQFLSHIRSLASYVSDDFLRSIWSSRLLSNVQAILAGQHDGSLNAAARCADRISEVAPQQALASVGPPPNNTALLHGIQELSRQVSALSAEQDRLRTVSGTLASVPGISDPAAGTAVREADPPPEMTPHPPSAGTNAQKSTPPCVYRQQGN
jgi:hypothetical protein